MARAHIKIQRVYGTAMPTSGKRVLVDRVWPRGVRKEELHLDLWLRELGPSTELRKWFSHKPERWVEFQRRYRHELVHPKQKELLGQIVELARKGPVTLLYGAHDEAHNQAVVLRSVLMKALGG